MASTQLDMLGSRAWVDSEGYHQIRKFQMTGLTTADAPLPARTVAALLKSSIPQIGDNHPYGPLSGMTVKRVSSETAGDDPSTVNGEIEYGPPTLLSLPPSYDADKAIISVNTVTAEVETQFDVDGEQIYTSHKDDSEGNPVKVAGSVKYYAPSTVITYERREPESPGTASVGGNTRASFVGTLNSAGVFSDPVRTWLCTEVSGVSNDGAQTWLVRYSFTRSPKIQKINGVETLLPWDATIVEIDPGTGNFVVGTTAKPLVDGRGKDVVKVQGERAFGDLSLTVT